MRENPSVMSITEREKELCGHERTQNNSYLDVAGTGDRNDVLSLGHEPSESDLGGGGIVLFTNVVDVLDELKDIGEVLLRKAGHEWAGVTLREVFR